MISVPTHTESGVASDVVRDTAKPWPGGADGPWCPSEGVQLIEILTGSCAGMCRRHEEPCVGECGGLTEDHLMEGRRAEALGVQADANSSLRS